MKTISPENYQEFTDICLQINDDPQATALMVLLLNKSSRSAGLQLINELFNGASESLQNDLTRIVTQRRTFIPKGKVYAILYLCGASYNALGKFFKISNQSVHSSSAKYITQDLVNTLKQQSSGKSRYTISDELIDQYYKLLDTWAVEEDRYNLLTEGTVVEIASALIASTQPSRLSGQETKALDKMFGGSEDDFTQSD